MLHGASTHLIQNIFTGSCSGNIDVESPVCFATFMSCGRFKLTARGPNKGQCLQSNEKHVHGVASAFIIGAFQDWM